MKNYKRRIETTTARQDTAFEGSNIGLIVFVAVAVWLLLFQSNIFK